MKDHRQPSPQVLLVEDNPDHAELALAALKASETGINFQVADDGPGALAFLEGTHDGTPRPDLILLDWNLPRMTGSEVLKRIKADPAFADIPVVVLSMSANEQDVQAAYQLGANCYITKPLDFTAFTEIITRVQAYWLKSGDHHRRTDGDGTAPAGAGLGSGPQAPEVCTPAGRR